MSETTDYVTLVSNDGFEFVVQRSSACIAEAIKRMLDPRRPALDKQVVLTDALEDNFSEAQTNTCKFENISGVVLEKVCEYLYYHEKFRDQKDVPDMDIPPELCLELLMAADYLNGGTSPSMLGHEPSAD
ncbi:elongin C [Cryomyces antarcticus]|uniref:Elongin-C n=1 Tax=Cryomyces antarcticus TaxID=329879 RepID=A0ABR0KVP3_9PEZI|nr:elongin C [Cryomyces antarcticus]